MKNILLTSVSFYLNSVYLCHHQHNHQQGTNLFFMEALQNPQAVLQNAEQAASERAQKKAARRAAFIQDVAEAVYQLGVQRQNEIEAKKQIQQQAKAQEATAQEKLLMASLAASSPIEWLYCQNSKSTIEERWAGARWAEKRAASSLLWAIQAGILPIGTTALPDTKAQFLALAPWQLALPTGLDLATLQAEGREFWRFIAPNAQGRPTTAH